MARKHRGARRKCAGKQPRQPELARVMKAAGPHVAPGDAGADGLASKVSVEAPCRSQATTTPTKTEAFKDRCTTSAAAIPNASTSAATCSPVSAPSPDTRRLRVEEPVPCPALSEPGLPSPRSAAAEGTGTGLPSRLLEGEELGLHGCDADYAGSLPRRQGCIRLPSSSVLGQRLGFVPSSSGSGRDSMAVAGALPCAPSAPCSSSGRSTSFVSTCDTALVDAKYGPSCTQPTAAEQKRRQESRLCEDTIAQAIQEYTKTAAQYVPGLGEQFIDRRVVQSGPDRTTAQVRHVFTGQKMAEKTIRAVPLEAAVLLQDNREAAVKAVVHALQHTAAGTLARELKGCELVRSAVAAKRLNFARFTFIKAFTAREVPRPADEEEVAGCRWFEVVLVSKWAARGSVADRLDEIKRRAWHTGHVDWKEVVSIHIQCCRILQILEDAGVLLPDWKLENLVMDAYGYISCIDFDDAQLLRAPPPGFPGLADRRLRGVDFLLRTWRYAAPEMLDEPEQVCMASHLYMLGRCMRFHIAELKEALEEYGQYVGLSMPVTYERMLDGLFAVKDWCVEYSPAKRPTPKQAERMLLQVWERR